MENFKTTKENAKFELINLDEQKELKGGFGQFNFFVMACPPPQGANKF